ncbi:MAG TPA: hypothetical protein VHE30_29715 [Polyangiaceae bacterium]|nr:hypothetical protein [Polyangiaceae bacterium]
MADDPHHEPWSPRRRLVVLIAGGAAACAVLALSVFSIVRDLGRRGPTPAERASPPPEPPATQSATAAAVLPSSEPEPVPEALAPADEAPSEFLDETDDGEPAAKPAPPRHFDTVQQAAEGSCSTASVDGLSRQIIEQARCIRPNAFVPLPKRPNLVLASNVFPYLELEARDHLVKVLDSHKSGKMTINSALRTVAQQYLVSRWAAGRRCGVQMATPPGDSNHEIGTALDIAEPATWRAALEQQSFHWLGKSDRVHFDYRTPTGSAHASTDVLAFQTLWNQNHPTDTIPANGRYDSGTERRLRKAPTAGFPIGPVCGRRTGAKRP